MRRRRGLGGTTGFHIKASDDYAGDAIRKLSAAQRAFFDDGDCHKTALALFDARQSMAKAVAHAEDQPGIYETTRRRLNHAATTHMSTDFFVNQCVRKHPLDLERRLDPDDEPAVKRFKLLELDGSRRRRGRR